jgi:hypothetical protein
MLRDAFGPPAAVYRRGNILDCCARNDGTRF